MRFEDLIAWQKARELCREIYGLTRTEKLRKDFGLCGQLQRASVSVMANIAEGFERNRKAEFHQFLSIAKGSCGELRSHLYVAVDAAYVEKDIFQALLTQVDEVGRIIGGLRSSVAKLNPHN